MGTTVYFEKVIKQEFKSRENEETLIDIGTSGFLGNGPQAYVRVGDEQVFIPRELEEEFFEQMDSLAHYLGYRR